MAIADLLRSKTADESAEPESTPEIEEDALTPDPKPTHRTRKPPRKTRPKGSLPTTVAGKKKLEGEVRDNLMMFLGLGSALGMKADPHCFGVLAQQVNPIVDALVPIIMRNANLLRWFAGSDAKYLEYLALAQALAPVVTTVFQHHVVKKDMGGGGDSYVNPLDLNTFQAPSFA